MNTMFKQLIAGAAFAFAILSASADQLVWYTDLAKAQAAAKAENKSVLLFFHGSDWCPTCIEMDKQVFQSAEFAAYARKVLVLVNVDFPEKSAQSEELKRANEALKAKFNVGENLPTLVLISDSGDTVYQEAGYAGGGPAEVLTPLKHHVPLPTTGADSGYKDLNTAEFAKMAADKQNIILDVRTMKEYQAGHIAGAINLDVSSKDFEQKAASLDKDKVYLVHCASGVRSVRACKALDQLGFPNLYNLTGGIRAWVAAGEPVEH